MIKANHLLSILSRINNNIQFTIEKNQIRLLCFLNIMINRSGTKIWMYIYSKATDSKRYVPFTSNHPQHCLTTTLFSTARRICTITENENVKRKCFEALKENNARIKIP